MSDGDRESADGFKKKKIIVVAAFAFFFGAISHLAHVDAEKNLCVGRKTKQHCDLFLSREAACIMTS